MIYEPPKRQKVESLSIAPPERSLEYVISSFDNALASCKHSSIEIRKPDYNGWLSTLYDYWQENKDKSWNFSLYPTAGQKRNIVDSWPKGFEPCEAERRTTSILTPPKRAQFPLLDKIDEILEPSMSVKGGYFRVGKGDTDKTSAKIYGCLIAKDALEFAKDLTDWVKTEKPQAFEGKFYADAKPGDHNLLCTYVPFKNFPELAEFLAENNKYFHKIKFNHPAGIELFPGASVVIANDDKGFDEHIKTELTDIITPSYSIREGYSFTHIPKSKTEFIQAAKQKFGKNNRTKYHFGYLK